MFRGRMTYHEVREPSRTDDGLGFTYDTWGDSRRVALYITTATQSDFNQNEFYTSRFDATAFSLEELPKGSKIDDTWLVDSVMFNRTAYTLGLVRIGESDG